MVALDLPQALRDALDGAIASMPGPRLAARVTDLSRAYRQTGRAGGGAMDGEAALAYAVYRLPATFAAVGAALAQVAEARPDLRPGTVLDAGAGPGSGLWAAAGRWPGLVRAVAVENDLAMLKLGRRLAAVAPHPAVRGAAWRQADLGQPLAEERFDVVLLSYVLGELASQEQAAVVDRLWRATAGVLVVVEPGTPAGFAAVRAARARLAGMGAAVVAPCPHGRACPMPEADWCHFAVRLERSRRHRQAKGGALPYEDEKFSFVALSRLAGMPATARVLRHPQVRGGHVRLRLCTLHGLRDDTVARSEGERYRLARRLEWGAAFPYAADPEA